MIDFRYHLVSIVSIFVALAVGIVLGAGPLQGGIGTQLTDQVSQLRQDMETLRTQRDDFGKTITTQEDYASAVAGAALGGRLKGESVALVVTPDTAGKFAELARTALTQGGATVTEVLTLKDAFRAPEAAADRLKAATSAAATLVTGSGETPSSDADQLLAQVLATVLVRPPTTATPARTSAPTPSPTSTAPTGPVAPLPGSAAALKALTSAGLLDASDEDPARASLVVVLGGPISGSALSVTAQTATMTTLVRTLDAASSGVVVAAGAPTTAVGQEVTTSLVSAVRADRGLAGVVSSVDHADSVVGAGTIVLALVEQEGGKAGHYGISADAKADVPTAP